MTDDLDPNNFFYLIPNGSCVDVMRQGTELILLAVVELGLVGRGGLVGQEDALRAFLNLARLAAAGGE